MSAKFVWPVRVYYEDTDAGGVVYHANYLRYMERARNEWLRDMGHPVEQIVEQEKKLFVVRSLEMKFVRPAKLSDELSVSAEVVLVKKASMQLRQEVRRGVGESGELLVSAMIELAMVDSESFRPVRLPEFLSQN
jgi:acyl-CoA thioester hydrolase